MAALSPLDSFDPDKHLSDGHMTGLSASSRTPTDSPVFAKSSPATPPQTSAAADPHTALANPTRVVVRREPRPFHLSPSPDEAEIKLVNGVLQLFTTAKSHRNVLLPRWNECYRMLTNRHWDISRRADWLPSPQIPEIFPIVRTLVAWQMDSRFRTAVSAAALPHSELASFFTGLAQDLEYTLDASWQANLEEREWNLACWDGMVYGTGFTKTSWEHQLAGGAGDAMARHISPFRMYPDPNATTLDDAEYIVEARDMSLQELDRRFPGAAAAFSQTGGLMVETDDPPSMLDLIGHRPARAYLNPAALSPSTNPNWNRPTQNPHFPSLDMPRVTVLECWIREHSYVDVIDIHTKQRVRRASDHWRVIVVANNRVLMDEPAENIWTHGGHPYSRYQPFEFNAEFWGVSLVELLISPQKALNRLLAALQHNLELTGNPMWLDSDQNIRNMPITNKPGQRVPIDRNDQRTGWLSPPPINQGAQQMVDYLLKRMEAISGITAILKGTQPSGRPSSSVIDSISESSHVGIRAMLRQMEYALRDSFQKKAALVVENYTEPRLISIAGEQGENTYKALRGRHFLIPSSDGAVPLKYQLIVDAGSRHHVSRQMRENRAVQLFAMEMIDEQAALAEIDFPNAKAVADRVAKRKAEMAAMEGGGVGPSSRTAARV